MGQSSLVSDYLRKEILCVTLMVVPHWIATATLLAHHSVYLSLKFQYQIFLRLLCAPTDMRMATGVFAEIIQHLRHSMRFIPESQVIHILESKQIQMTQKENVYLHVRLEREL